MKMSSIAPPSSTAMRCANMIEIGLSELSEMTDRVLGRRARSARELADGWFNTIYAIELEDGTEVVLKLAPPPGFPVMRYGRSLMEAEVAVLRRLRDVEDVPVPDVLAYETGGSVHPHDFFFMEYVPGEAFAEGYTDRAETVDRPGAERCIWLYDLSLAAIMRVECAYRAFEDDHVAWATTEFERVVQLARPGWI
ncbi:MAG: phosphotransferase family protein [Spirochaetota bacterium]